MRTPLMLLAALAVAASAACGEVSGFIDAAPGDDDTIDASTVDAEQVAGPVNVTTHSMCCNPPAGPIAGIPIFVVHADGTLGDTATSDANGQATVDVLPGSSVTAVYDRAPGATIQTFAAVVPGDELSFGTLWTEGTKNSLVASVTVNWTAQPGVSYFYLYGACSYYYVGGTSTSYVDDIYSNCPAGPSTYHLVGYDGNGNALRYGTIPSVSHTTQTVTVPSFTPGQNFTTSVTGIPSEITGVYLYNSATYGDDERYVTGFSSYVTPTGGSVSHSRTWPTAMIDAVYTQAEYTRNGPYNSQYQYDRSPGASNRTIANPRLLPWLSQVIYSEPTREVLWIQAGEEQYDSTMVNAYWSRSPGTPAVWHGSGGGSEYYDWTIILPPGITHVDLPEAPAALRQYLPNPDDFVDVYVQITDSAEIDDYRDVVALPFWFQYDLAEYTGDIPLIRKSSGSTGGGGKGRLLPRHGLANQLEPASHR